MTANIIKCCYFPTAKILNAYLTLYLQKKKKFHIKKPVDFSAAYVRQQSQLCFGKLHPIIIGHVSAFLRAARNKFKANDSKIKKRVFINVNLIT